jgi:hypothetical protein
MKEDEREKSDEEYIHNLKLKITDLQNKLYQTEKERDLILKFTEYIIGRRDSFSRM